MKFNEHRFRVSPLSRNIPTQPTIAAHYERIFSALCSHTTTRRGFLIGVGAGLPLVGALARAAANFSSRQDQYGATVMISDVPVWRIDTRWFDGRPQVRYRSSADTLLLELRNAFFPGTHLPADLILSARRRGTEWHARFKLEGLNFTAETRFQMWLLGMEPAVGSMRVETLAIASAKPVALTGVGGPAAFRPNWTISSDQLVSGQLQLYDQIAALDAFHFSLHVSEEPELPSSATSRHWVSLASGSKLSFDTHPAQLDIGPASANAFVEAHRESATLVVEAGTSGDSVGPATLTWRASGQVALSASEALGKIEFAKTGTASSGSALLAQPQWLVMDGIAAEFSAGETGSPIRLVTSEPVAVESFASTPVARRFVATLAGCDAAWFSLRAPVTVAPPHVGNSEIKRADAFHFAHQRIPLDGYDLHLRRASDSLFCTVRFRSVTLCSRLGKWFLERTGSERALIEFDLGVQHLLEEAEYITDWCRKHQTPVDFPVADEIVVIAVREYYEKNKRYPDFLKDYGNPAFIPVQDLIKILRTDPDYERYRRILGKQQSAGKAAKLASRFEPAKPTHLVFALDSDAQEVRLPFSMESLFSWTDDGTRRNVASNVARLVPVLPRRAAPAGTQLLEGTRDDLIITRPQSLAGNPREGSEIATAIEAPARLVISPIPLAAGPARANPQIPWLSPSILPPLPANAKNGRAELWSVRLINAKIRAVFSEDANGDRYDGGARIKVSVFKPPAPYRPTDPDFRASLDRRDRHELVALTALYGFESRCGTKQVAGCSDTSETGQYVPRPIDADLLLLSSQGATFKYRGFWDPPSSPPSEKLQGALSVLRYDHRAQIGRDIFARVEYKGFLFPLGQPAILVKVTERRFCMPGKQTVATLVQRFFIHVPRFTRAFPTIGQPFEGRLWGHAAIGMEEFTTPDLVDPAKPDSKLPSGTPLPLGTTAAFWPRVPEGTQDKDVLFEFREEASNARYRAPLIFVDNNVAHNDTELEKVFAHWRAAVNVLLNLPEKSWGAQDPRYFADVVSARLPYLPGERGENSDIETTRVLLGVHAPNETDYGDDPVRLADLEFNARMEAQNQPPFYPVRRRARIKSAQIAILTGKQDSAFLLDFDRVYRDNGFDAAANGAQVFGVFVKEGPLMSFGEDTSRSGGFASPSALIVWMSRLRGPLGGTEASLVRFGKPAPAPARTLTASGARNGPRHDDDFDPKEYFGAVLGDAKLLGVVRLVDILNAVLMATGTEIPTIRRLNLFDMSLEALRFIFPAVEDVVRKFDAQLIAQHGPSTDIPAQAAARLRPYWGQFRAAVQQAALLLKSSSPSELEVLAAGNTLSTSATALTAEVRAMAQDPVVLLPQDAQQLIRETLGLLAALRQTLPPPELVRELTSLAQDMAARQFEERMQALLAQFDSNPGYAALRASLAALRKGIADFRQSIQDASGALEALHQGVLTRLVQAGREVLSQLDLIRELQEAVCTPAVAALNDFIRTQVECARDRIEQLEPAAMRLVDNLHGLLDQCTAAAADPALTDKERATVEQVLARARQGTSNLAMLFNAQLDRLTRLAAASAQLKAWFSGTVGKPCPAAQLPRVQLEVMIRASIDALQESLETPDLALRATLQLADIAATLSALDIGSGNIPLVMRKVGFRNPLAGASIDLGYAISKQSLLEIRDRLKRLHVAVSNTPIAVHLGPLLDRSFAAVQALSDMLFSPGLLTARSPLPWGQAQYDFVAAIQKHFGEEFPKMESLDQVRVLLIQALRMTSSNTVEEAVRSDVNRRLAGLRDELRETLEVRLQRTVSTTVQQFCGEPAAQLHRQLAVVAESASRFLTIEAKNSVAEMQRVLKDCSAQDRVDTDFLERIVRRFLDLSSLLGRLTSTGEIGQLVDLDRTMAVIIDSLGVPSRVRIEYDWNTTVEAYPRGDDAVFEPLENKRLTISAVMETSLRTGQASARMDAALSPFAIHLFGKDDATNFLTINFSELVLKTRPGQGTECTTDVTLVRPGKALGFVSRLSALFGARSGFLMLPLPRGIRVGYEYNKPFDILGGFVLQNIAFSIYADLPFDNSPVRFSMQLADRIKPFLISAGIYGGGGFLSVRTQAETLEVLEASFEYGAMAAFEYGPAAGSGRITAGIYILMGNRVPVIEGFFCATGEVRIAGLITMEAMLRVTLSYKPGGNASGWAEYSFDFSIGIIEYSYRAQVDYAREGDGGSDGTALFDNDSLFMLARAEQAVDRSVCTDAPDGAGILSGEQGNVGTAPRRKRRHAPDLGLLRPDAWQRYWAAFVPYERPDESRWMSVSRAGSTMQALQPAPKIEIPDEPGERGSLSQIQWYTVPWGFKANASNTLKVSLRILPAFTSSADQCAKAAMADWPAFVAAIETATFVLEASEKPASVKLGEQYRSRLKELGLKIDDMSAIWKELFPDTLVLPTKHKARNESTKVALHDSADLAARAAERSGRLFTESLANFDRSAAIPSSADGYVMPSPVSAETARFLNDVASIYLPVTARHARTTHQSGKDEQQRASRPVSSWIEKTVIGSQGIEASFVEQPPDTVVTPYSDKAIRYLRTLADRVNNADNKGLTLSDDDTFDDKFTHRLIERQVAFTTELPDNFRRLQKNLRKDTGVKGESFHDRLAGIASHPWLMKVLGLVIDLEITLPPGVTPTFVMMKSWKIGGQIIPPLDELRTLVENGWPKMRTAPQEGVPQTYRGGLLDISARRGQFLLTQLDVDRSPLRIRQLAIAHRNETLSGRRPAEIVAALQPQETVGLSLIEKKKTSFNYTKSDRKSAGPVNIYLDDLLLGYRPDVEQLIPGQDPSGARVSAWTSLTARTLKRVRLKGRDITDWFARVGVDEAVLVERARTIKPNSDKPDDPADQLLDGERFRWGTWALGTSHPDTGPARADSDMKIGTSAQQSAGLQIEYEALPGATPQRYGLGYRVGMRLVMVDGNSISLKDAQEGNYREVGSAPGSENSETMSLGDETSGRDFGFAPFLRFEPVLPPAILLVDRPKRDIFASDGARKLIVASSATNGRATSTRRVFAPPRCASLDLAIRHGMFDRADFQSAPPASAFPNVVLTEQGDFPTWSHAYVGLPAGKTATEERYFNRLTSAPVPVVPYYPDPWAERVVIGFYRWGDNRLMYVDFFDYYDHEHRWPECRELQFEIRAVERVADSVLGFELVWAGNRLTVRVAPGVHLALRVWHEMDVDKLNQSAIVDQMVQAAFDASNGTDLRKNLRLSASAKREEIRAQVIERLSRWHERRNWNDQTARPVSRKSSLLNMTSFWMLNPFEEIEVLHAAPKPLRAPELAEGSRSHPALPSLVQAPARMSALEIPFSIERKAAETSATFRGHVRLDRATTRNIDAHASWTDNAGKPSLNAAGKWETKVEARNALLFSLRDLAEVASNDSGAPPPDPLPPELDATQHLQRLDAMVPVSPARLDDLKPVTTPFDFGDTRARVIEVELHAAARHAHEFAGAENASHVVRSPRKRVIVLGSERPQPPVVAYVMPLYQWASSSAPGATRRTREAGWFRIWLEGDWYTCGNGELLALVCWPSELLDPAPRRLLLSRTRETPSMYESSPAEVEPYLTRWGLDPLLQERNNFGNLPASALKNRLRSLADLVEGQSQPDATLKTDLHHLQDIPTFTPQFDLAWLPDMPFSSGKTQVALALYRPRSDPASGRQYVDIQIDPGYAYQPFVRLALARYQPHALEMLRLSKILPTEFIQLLPERSVTVVPKWEGSREEKEFEVTLAGTALSLGRTGRSASMLHARIEEQPLGLVPQVEDQLGNGAWIPAADADVFGTKTNQTSTLPYDAREGVWRGTVKFKHRIGRRYSLVLEEYEMLDDGQGGKAGRLVYFDRIILIG